MQELAAALRNHAGEIVDRWDKKAKESEPYLSLSTRDERLDHLVEVVTTLAFACLPESNSREDQREALDSAAQHGVFRREQGFTTEDVLKEYYFIRHALWDFIREHASGPKSASIAIGRIDQAASLTSRAALLGLHKSELEKQGKWPKVIDDLLGWTPFLGG